MLYPSSHTGMKSEQYLRPSDRVNLHWWPLDVSGMETTRWRADALRKRVLFLRGMCMGVGWNVFRVSIITGTGRRFWCVFSPPSPRPARVGRMQVLRLPRLAAFFVALSPPGASRSPVRIVVCSQISESSASFEVCVSLWYSIFFCLWIAFRWIFRHFVESFSLFFFFFLSGFWDKRNKQGEVGRRWGFFLPGLVFHPSWRLITTLCLECWWRYWRPWSSASQARTALPRPRLSMPSKTIT